MPVFKSFSIVWRRRWGSWEASRQEASIISPAAPEKQSKWALPLPLPLKSEKLGRAGAGMGAGMMGAGIDTGVGIGASVGVGAGVDGPWCE